MGTEISRELRILPVNGITIFLSLLRYRTKCKSKWQKNLKEKDQLRKVGKVDYNSFFRYVSYLNKIAGCCCGVIHK
jgi:hypothetical protein